MKDAHLEAHLVQRRAQGRRSAEEDADLGGGMGRSDRAEDAIPVRPAVLRTGGIQYEFDSESQQWLVAPQGPQARVYRRGTEKTHVRRRLQTGDNVAIDAGIVRVDVLDLALLETTGHKGADLDELSGDPRREKGRSAQDKIAV